MRNLLVAFIPAVVIGLAIGDYIELLLGNAVVVAWALIIGGVAILIIERLSKPTDCGGVANVTLRHSIGIGLVQCLAMIPGVSRSGATILGAMSFGVDRKTAAEFSFFLAVPTLTGATALQLFKHWDEIPRRPVRLDRARQPRFLHRRDRRREGVHRRSSRATASGRSPGTGSSSAQPRSSGSGRADSPAVHRLLSCRGVRNQQLDRYSRTRIMRFVLIALPLTLFASPAAAQQAPPPRRAGSDPAAA